MEHDVYDVLFERVLLTNAETSCWRIQNVERSEVLVHTNDLYNIYIPLIIRQANDVEENPGPTIFDAIDPATTVCADYSQGNESLFEENAGIKATCSNVTYCYYLPSYRRY